jgi:hypothetical protein
LKHFASSLKVLKRPIFSFPDFLEIILEASLPKLFAQLLSIKQIMKSPIGQKSTQP